MSISDRLVQIRKAQAPKMSQTAFAESIGMVRGRYKNYEDGTVIPDESTLKLICLTFGVSRRWLETGEGEMFLPPQETEDISAELRRVLRGKGETAQSALLALASLPDSWFDTLADALEKTKHTKK